MTLILTRSQIAALLRTPDLTGTVVTDAVEEAFAALADGTDRLSPAHGIREGDDLFLPMLAASTRLGLAGGKVLADLPGNALTGLPRQRSAITLISTETGACAALLDGALPTRVRTAAASAVATRHLARPDTRVLGLVGAGALAVEHTVLIAAERPIEEVVVWSRSFDRVASFRAELSTRAPDLKVTHADGPRSVIDAADVVCTLTPSREPIVRGSWLRPGQHLNVVGAPPRPDCREVDGVAMSRSRIVVDAMSTATADSGDLVLALAEGAVTTGDCADLGSVICGLAEGRTSPDEITLFDSTGLGLLDLAIGRVLVDAARRHGIGHAMELGA
ncbi:ornithine cyclodeaminase family protein [Nocardioides cavernaquae]|uniref:Ornithine cyclodeaminase family protein n=1 Tax=Nocardioides cavernaquae TaxID=2321396 RepID=A0A3A5HBL9_9ACTN|nr:ornithine cyclodeaminase family protein [Nocardioides cavernaquae]RJS47501.1 ornithine cyclodeaminase family protein [Nocardioides cavernaquae]